MERLRHAKAKELLELDKCLTFQCMHEICMSRKIERLAELDDCMTYRCQHADCKLMREKMKEEIAEKIEYFEQQLAKIKSREGQEAEKKRPRVEDPTTAHGDHSELEKDEDKNQSSRKGTEDEDEDQDSRKGTGTEFAFMAYEGCTCNRRYYCPRHQSQKKQGKKLHPFIGPRRFCENHRVNKKEKMTARKRQIWKERKQAMLCMSYTEVKDFAKKYLKAVDDLKRDVEYIYEMDKGLGVHYSRRTNQWVNTKTQLDNLQGIVSEMQNLTTEYPIEKNSRYDEAYKRKLEDCLDRMSNDLDKWKEKVAIQFNKALDKLIDLRLKLEELIEIGLQQAKEEVDALPEGELYDEESFGSFEQLCGILPYPKYPAQERQRKKQEKEKEEQAKTRREYLKAHRREDYESYKRKYGRGYARAAIPDLSHPDSESDNDSAPPRTSDLFSESDDDQDECQKHASELSRDSDDEEDKDKEDDLSPEDLSVARMPGPLNSISENEEDWTYVKKKGKGQAAAPIHSMCKVKVENEEQEDVKPSACSEKTSPKKRKKEMLEEEHALLSLEAEKALRPYKCTQGPKEEDLINRYFWLADSGATSHMTNNDEGMFDIEEIDLDVKVGNGRVMKVRKMGSLRLRKGNQEVVLKNVKYIPELWIQLFSIPMALKNGYTLGSECTLIHVRKAQFKLEFDCQICSGDSSISGCISGVHLYPVLPELATPVVEENKGCHVNALHDILGHPDDKYLRKTALYYGWRLFGQTQP